LSFSDLFQILPLGFTEDNRPGYPIVSFFLTKYDFYKLIEVLELYSHLEPLFATAFSDSVTLKVRSWGIPFVNRFSEMKLHGLDYDKWPALIKISCTDQVATYIFKIKTVTRGWIEVKPLDAEGRPLQEGEKVLESQQKEYQLLAHGFQGREIP
jgi:hypothetical protein